MSSINSTLQSNITTQPNNNLNLQKCNDNESDKEPYDTTHIEIINKDSTGKYIYLIFHMIMSFVAIFLSWKCNNGKFDILSFLIALFFPYIYIIFILATRGTCDKI